MTAYSLYVECGADTDSEKFPFTRKHYMHPSETYLFRNKYSNVGVYETVMQYINPTFYLNEKQKWVLNARECLKWGDLYLDFDIPLENDNDFNKIKHDVQKAIRYFKLILSVDPSQINLFYSGSKGIHMTVSAHVLGLEPHQSLNQIYKDIATDISEFTEYGTLDTKVYDDKRMFRMVNSFNKKGQRYKIPLKHEELWKMTLAEVRELALEQRFLDPAPMIISPKAKKSLDEYIKHWNNRIIAQKEYQGRISKLERLPPCIEAMTVNLFKETIDERNNSGTALASFYMQQGMAQDEALARMILWGEENCVPPLKRVEMETITNSVYGAQYKYGCSEFHRLSGVCDKSICPLFNRDMNKKKEEPQTNKE